VAECFGRDGFISDVYTVNVGDRLSLETDSAFQPQGGFSCENPTTGYSLLLQVIKCCKNAGIKSVYDVMEMKDDKQNNYK
jgi:hypothetical protein